MKKILFFDDEPYISKYLVQTLRFEWEDITLVSIVDALLKEIKKDDVTYDLFILDVMAPMPSDKLKEQFTQEEWEKMDFGMSMGLVLSEKIRREKKYTDVPIIYLTARQIPPIPESEKGITAYLRKPVSPDEISDKMNELLKIK